MFAELDRQFPGIRFRVVDEQARLRKHMKVFVNDEAVRDLATEIAATDEVTIMQAPSGGRPHDEVDNPTSTYRTAPRVCSRGKRWKHTSTTRPRARSRCAA